MCWAMLGAADFSTGIMTEHKKTRATTFAAGMHVAGHMPWSAELHKKW